MTVYVSGGGRRYHASPDCPKLLSAQDLWDWDCDDYCRHDHGRARSVVGLSLATAAAQGLQPCVGCKPETAVAPVGDFGHEPMLVRQFGGAHLHAEFEACARCYPMVPLWPCASAVALGLTTPKP